MNAEEQKAKLQQLIDQYNTKLVEHGLTPLLQYVDSDKPIEKSIALVERLIHRLDAEQTGRLNPDNRYDAKDMVRQLSCLHASPLRVACYQVRDPKTLEWSPREFHMTWDNYVLGKMGEEAAKLFSRFVISTLSGRSIAQTPDERRAEFEAWAVQNPCLMQPDMFDRDGDGYADDSVDVAWTAWEARAAMERAL